MTRIPRPIELAQCGYQAYIADTGGLNYQGLPCPAWDDLPTAQRVAWAASVRAIIDRWTAGTPSAEDKS